MKRKENVQETHVLYDNEKVITVVEVGQSFGTPDTVNIFVGSLEDFAKEHPDIKLPEPEPEE